MKKNFLLFIFLFLTLIVNAQKIDSVLNIYASLYQPEKMHLHFDKAAYNKGETIWFKAYMLAGSDWTEYSKNFYADWYDDKGKLLMHEAAPIFESSAKGQFQIPEKYTGHFVHVKAYTQWMLNFDEGFLFEKDIPVNQPQTKTSIPNYITTVTLFPEGGDLVINTNCRIAYKAENQFGKPVYIKAAIKNNKGELIDSVAAEHDGMGSFNLEPKENETYSFNWIDENGKQNTTAFPIAKKTGATLEIENLDNKILAFIKRTTNADDIFKTMYLVATMNQQMVYRSRINFSVKTNVSAELPTNNLPTGILRLTLFTADWKPIAERITFINNHDYEFFPSIRATTKGLEKRKKNILEVEVGDTLLSNMSISVTDGDLEQDKSNDIISSLLLSSELKGNIHNPTYYFSSNADSVAHFLDLVMLTNGWRKYKWDDIVAGKLPQLKYARDTDYLQISGKVFGSAFERNGLSKTINIVIQNKDSSKQFLFLPVNPDGTFVQRGAIFYDTVKLYYMFNGDRKLTDRTDVRFNTGLFSAYQSTFKTHAQNIQYTNSFMGQARLKYFLDEQDRLKKLAASTTLETVTVKAKTKSNLDLLDEKYTTGMFSNGDGYSFDVSNDPFGASSLDVFRYLQGKVAGLNINYGGGEPTLSWRGGSPSLFLDEMTTQTDVLQGIPMSDVAYIKVFRPPFFGAFGGGGNGAIAIYTKRGKDGKRIYSNAPGLNTSVLAGYSTYKVFYSPNYDNSKYDNGPDTRTTLYWNPYLLTDKKTKTVQIEFYNNDVSNKFHVVIEGINAEGKLARVEKDIQ
ncbi:MAG: hypothetical protein JSR09_07255 [Bacteroidetes bacterium]|nr:hypothetical protein [Bacteroidota bacterium]MBS1649491.1 hypothetical protein [Bacteroidota bacterium]